MIRKRSLPPAAVAVTRVRILVAAARVDFFQQGISIFLEQLSTKNSTLSESSPTLF